MKTVTIHSDGACDPNPGPGGWAAVLECDDRQREISGYALATTNNRMEMQAAVEALRALKHPCTVLFYTDSEYLRHGMTLWVPGWKRKGWKTKERKPVKNADLWRELDDLAAKHTVHWHWLKAHAGHVTNERCDRLAAEQILKLRSEHTPAALDAALSTFKAHQLSSFSADAAMSPPATNREMIFD
jgi:ribonuclease HI